MEVPAELRAVLVTFVPELQFSRRLLGVDAPDAVQNGKQAEDGSVRSFVESPPNHGAVFRT
jgi:hypothetical protein